MYRLCRNRQNYKYYLKVFVQSNYQLFSHPFHFRFHLHYFHWQRSSCAHTEHLQKRKQDGQGAVVHISPVVQNVEKHWYFYKKD